MIFLVQQQEIRVYTVANNFLV